VSPGLPAATDNKTTDDYTEHVYYFCGRSSDGRVTTPDQWIEATRRVALGEPAERATYPVRSGGRNLVFHVTARRPGGEQDVSWHAGRQRILARKTVRRAKGRTYAPARFTGAVSS
jgi:hypothetical protein